MPEPTARERFARCLDHVLVHEGGYVDHPTDPGGATNMGITRKTPRALAQGVAVVEASEGGGEGAGQG